MSPRAPSDTADDATLALAQALVRRQSVTPDDGGCLELIAARLGAAGFACTWIERGGVRNLWARYGQTAPLVCFAGHVDVVPAGDVGAWSVDPFGGTVRDGALWGRGAADMKGSVAAMVVAAERLAMTDRPGSLAVLLTADEEGAAIDGTRAVVEWLREQSIAIDYCIVGEPTSSEQFGDTMKVGRRGSLGGTLEVAGAACHIAYPERGENPIHRAMPALTALAAVRWDDGTEDFPPTQFQWSNVHAGDGTVNVIPGRLVARFNLRYSPLQTVAAMQTRIAEILQSHGLRYHIDWQDNGRPFHTGRGALTAALSAAVAAVTGQRPSASTSGGTSDGRFLVEVAREVVEFGPLNGTIHQPDERVAVADLQRLTDVYAETARALLR